MTGYVLGKDADLDLDEIWEYIAADDAEAADRWTGKLFDAFEALGKAPGMGHKRQDLTTTLSCSGLSATISSSTASSPHQRPSKS